jgi:hypothetical protein
LNSACFFIHSFHWLHINVDNQLNIPIWPFFIFSSSSGETVIVLNYISKNLRILFILQNTFWIMFVRPKYLFILNEINSIIIFPGWFDQDFINGRANSTITRSCPPMESFFPWELRLLIVPMTNFTKDTLRWQWLQFRNIPRTLNLPNQHL